MIQTISGRISLLLRAAVCLIFIGRAWQHLFWDAPYRSFFWDEALLKPLVENLFTISWQEYVTSTTTDQFIQGLIKGNGILYVLAGICTWLLHGRFSKWARIPLWLGGISLIILSALLTKEKFYHAAQFFEHSIQFGLPFILLFYEKLKRKQLLYLLKILIAVTFVSHGLYAFGFYPVPGKFVDMTIQIFGCTESTAITFLYIAGILDFLLAILIFIPKIEVYALWYAFFWGLLTAFARITANFYIDFPFETIHQNLHETLYRIPHGLVPLLVLILLKKRLSTYSKTPLDASKKMHSLQ